MGGGSCATPIEPRKFLQVQGYNTDIRVLIYGLLGGCAFLSLVLFVCFCEFKSRRVASRHGGPARQMLAGTRPLMFGVLLSIALVLGLGFEYNTHQSLLQAQDVAQSCDAAIWRAVDVLADNLLRQANRSIVTRLGLMASAILLDDTDSPLPLAAVADDRAAQDLLRRHLWAVTRAYKDALDMYLFVGFVQPFRSYTAYSVVNASNVRYICAPCANVSQPMYFPSEVASYEVSSDGYPATFSGYTPYIPSYFLPNETRRSPSGIPLPRVVLYPANVAQLTIMMTTPAVNSSGDVPGVLAVQSPVDLVGDRLQGMFSSMVFDSSVLFLLLDDAYYVIWTNQQVPILDGNSRLRVDQLGTAMLASLGETLLELQCGNGGNTWTWTTNASGTPARYVVRTVEVEIGWLLVLALPESVVYRAFEPGSLFRRLVHRSLAADIAVGVVGAAVVIAVVLLYFGLLMRPNNHVEAIAKLLVVAAVPSVAGMLIAVAMLLNGADPAEEAVLEGMCETATAASGQRQTAWHSAMVARGLEDRMLSLMLADELLFFTVQQGLLSLTNLDGAPEERQALIAFQWQCFTALPQVSWMYWGARYSYAGYEALLNGTVRFWTNGTLQSDQQSSSTAQWYLVNTSTGLPYGGPVLQQYDFYLQGQDFYVQGLKFARSMAYATELDYQDTRDGLSLSFLRFVPGVPGGTELGAVAAAEYSPPLLNALMQTISVLNGVVYVIDMGSKALLCADVPLTLMVNGHPVLADESENVMVRSSFTQLKERGYLLAWRNATFAYSHNGYAYLCSLMPTFAKVNGLDVLVVNVLAYDDWKAQIIVASTSWRALRQKVQAFEMAFLVFGGLAAGAGVLLALTVYGVIVWKKKLKNAALVEKMLWDTQPSEHQVPGISSEPPDMGVADFCRRLPRAHFPDSAAPHPKSIGRMLRQSTLCLQRRVARRVIQECGLTEDEALAVCVYTSELQPGSLSESWFSLPSATFQIYREMNAALRSKSPERIHFWHPLLHPLLAGLRKMRGLKDVPHDGPPPSLWRRLFRRKVSVMPYALDLVTLEADRTLYRGIALSARLYHPGDHMVWAAFSSCSYSLGVAKGFCNAEAEDGPVARTMFFLEAHSGVRISALSHFPKEEEVLLLPGTSFRVGNCGCEKFDRFANGVRFIELIEEPMGITPNACVATCDVEGIPLPPELSVVPAAPGPLPP
eukprot:EG_transcript_1085